jgi:hypothetical protein
MCTVLLPPGVNSIAVNEICHIIPIQLFKCSASKHNQTVKSAVIKSGGISCILPLSVCTVKDYNPHMTQLHNEIVRIVSIVPLDL